MRIKVLLSLILHLSWKSYLSGNLFSSTFQKALSIKLGKLNVDFKDLCLKMGNQIQSSGNNVWFLGNKASR